MRGRDKRRAGRAAGGTSGGRDERRAGRAAGEERLLFALLSATLFIVDSSLSKIEVFKKFHPIQFVLVFKLRTVHRI